MCLCRQRERIKFQQQADRAKRSQQKRKYIQASEAAPSDVFRAQLEATGGIVAVSSLAKNKLDFSGAKPNQHIKFDDEGQPQQTQPAAAPAGLGSNKSAAQLLRDKLKAGNSSTAEMKQEPQDGCVDMDSSQAAGANGLGTSSPPAALVENGGSGDSTPTPGEPSPKRARTAEADDCADVNMADAGQNIKQEEGPADEAAAADKPEGPTASEVRQKGCIALSMTVWSHMRSLTLHSKLSSAALHCTPATCLGHQSLISTLHASTTAMLCDFLSEFGSRPLCGG